MKCIIAGSRTIGDYPLLLKAIERSGFSITEVICGEAIGVDKLGRQWAIANDIPIISMPANWNLHKKAAGPIRNKQMADVADACIALWDGKSPGTRNMIDNMIKQNKPYYLAMTESFENWFE